MTIGHKLEIFNRKKSSAVWVESDKQVKEESVELQLPDPPQSNLYYADGGQQTFYYRTVTP